MSEEQSLANKEEMKSLIRQIIREELTFETKTESVYTGGLDDGSLYRDCHIIEVIFGNEVIASFSV